jgi:hypothetical protein
MNKFSNGIIGAFLTIGLFTGCGSTSATPDATADTHQNDTAVVVDSMTETGGSDTAGDTAGDTAINNDMASDGENPIDSNNVDTNDTDATNVEIEDDTIMGGDADDAGDTATGDSNTGDLLDTDSAITDAIVDIIDQDTTIPVPSWVDPATSLTWQSPAAIEAMTWFVAETYCTDLGTGWRLPTISELRTLIQGCPASESQGTCPVTDKCSHHGCFDNTCYGCDQLSNPTNPTGPGGGCYWQDGFGGSCDSYWWSGTNTQDDANYAWSVNFTFGLVSAPYKMLAASVRCVQDAPGTWRDPTSGLTWQNPPSDPTYPWVDALTYCNSMMLGGPGWHIPTVNELRTLIRGCDSMVPGGSCNLTDTCVNEMSCFSPGCYGCTLGEGPSNGCYWPPEILGECNKYYFAATERNPDDATNEIWTVIFGNGQISNMSTQNEGWVRCVK